MLASNSDSDFEYPDGGGSDASSECGGLLGKLALGIDPQEMRSYDGRSTPQNGSQYLLRVMKEKKTVPKVVCADVSQLNMKRGAESESVAPDYLNRFLRRCNAYEEQNIILQESEKLRPSSKWREETISSFSMTRNKVERWFHKIESREILLDKAAFPVPQNNDSNQWLKFCFGQPFIILAASRKNKSAEENLSHFFFDLYDPSVCEELTDKSQVEDETSSVNASSVGADGDQCSSSTKSGNETESKNNDLGSSSEILAKSKESAPIVFGYRPLMNLVMQFNQYQLENLIKWNLLWLKNIGFINQCQGQWLYAILACLFKPIDPSVMSDIRSIGRFLINVRNSMSVWNAPSPDKTGLPNNEEGYPDMNMDEKTLSFVNTLNLFIYTIADYFEQKDLITKV